MTALDAFERWPWTWIGPAEVRDEYGRHFEMQIAELPDYFVAGETADEVLREKDEALRAFLASYVERNEVPPFPVSTISAWQMIVHGGEDEAPAERSNIAPIHLKRVAG
jgi:predicted RNase H-like HicB family nuclease